MKFVIIGEKGVNFRIQNYRIIWEKTRFLDVAIKGSKAKLFESCKELDELSIV